MIQNIRDLGGTVTQDGKVIKPHCLIRSAHLFQATEADLKTISTIIDLRTPGERREAPDQTYQRQYLPVPIFDDMQAGISHEDGADDQGIPDMAHLYGRLVNECADSFRNVLKAIMEHDYSTGAVLWHCTEGKDRCGLTSAMILEMLGVDQKTIMEDYLKTNLVNLPKAIRMYDRVVNTHGKAFADSIYQAYIADEKYLQAAWDAMGKNYYVEKLGISQAEINRFGETVLE